jgi:flotillin
MEPDYWLISVIALVVIFVFFLLYLAKRYKRCAPDQILVIFGKVGVGQSARCIHGGGALVWPLVQDWEYISLTPLTIGIDLKGALSQQNIRVNVPSTFTVGISTEAAIMNNAAERLLMLPPTEIETMAKEIIFGQLRLTVASLTIEQINQDRESFLLAIRKNVEPELNKIGLYLINVNITDIIDASGYIDAIGKKAASEAINQAKIDVANQERIGAVGQAEAAKEREIKVAENVAQGEKGKKKAEADRRIYVQAQETEAIAGEAQAIRTKEIAVAQNNAEARMGEKKAQAEQRVFVQAQEANAVKGENEATAQIAESTAELAVKQSLAMQKGEVAKREALVEIQKAQARAEMERLNAAEIVQKEIEKRKIEISADAEAQRLRKEAQGQADATLAKYEAEAKGIRQVLDAKAAGYRTLVESCNGDAKGAATFLLVEKLPELVAKQVEAIQGLVIEKITVWESGGSGSSSTANFISNLVKSLPPLHELGKMAGVELPGFLGTIQPASTPNPYMPNDK